MISLDGFLDSVLGCHWDVSRHPGDNIHHTQRRRAFTLIELLVVISVIAVLMGILLPVLGRAREQARKIKCQANMRQIGLALQVYLPDYDYRLPRSTCNLNPDDPNAFWLHTLNDFTREQLLLHCPADQARDFVDWDEPLAKQTDRRYSSFSVNALLDPIHYRYGSGWNRYNRILSIRHPQSCIWISEAPDTDNFNQADHIHPETWEGSIDYAKQFIAYDRHTGTSNYLFVDGHTEDLKIEQTYQWPEECLWFPESAPSWPSDIFE